MSGKKGLRRKEKALWPGGGEIPWHTEGWPGLEKSEE